MNKRINAVTAALAAVLVFGAATVQAQVTRLEPDLNGTATVVDSAGRPRTVLVNPTVVDNLRTDVIVTPELVTTDAFVPTIIDENNEAPDASEKAPFTYAVVMDNGDVLTKAGEGQTFVYWGAIRNFRNAYYYRARDTLPLNKDSGFFMTATFPATNEPLRVKWYAGGYGWDYSAGIQVIGKTAFEQVPSSCDRNDFFPFSSLEASNLAMQYKPTASLGIDAAYMGGVRCRSLSETKQLGPMTVELYPVIVQWDSRPRGAQGIDSTGFAILTKTVFATINGQERGYFWPWGSDVDHLEDVPIDNPSWAAVALRGQERRVFPSSSSSGTWNTTDKGTATVHVLYAGSRNYSVLQCIRVVGNDGVQHEFRVHHNSLLEPVQVQMRFEKLCDEVLEKVATDQGTWVIANTASAVIGYEMQPDGSSVWRAPKTEDDMAFYKQMMDDNEYVNVTYPMAERAISYMLTDIYIKPPPETAP